MRKKGQDKRSKGGLPEGSSHVTSSTPAAEPTKEESQVCQICNDVASGYHYGVWSCEGCKAFFKRSLQGAVNYICPATNNCTIDKARRKCCQACRLRLCHEVGMAKTVTRRERKNKKGQKRKGEDQSSDPPESIGKTLKTEKRSKRTSTSTECKDLEMSKPTDGTTAASGTCNPYHSASLNPNNGEAEGNQETHNVMDPLQIKREVTMTSPVPMQGENLSENMPQAQRPSHTVTEQSHSPEECHSANEISPPDMYQSEKDQSTQLSNQISPLSSSPTNMVTSTWSPQHIGTVPFTSKNERNNDQNCIHSDALLSVQTESSQTLASDMDMCSKNISQEEYVIQPLPPVVPANFAPQIQCVIQNPQNPACSSKYCCTEDSRTESQPPQIPSLLQCLINIDLPKRKTEHRQQQEETELSVMTDVVRLADVELTDIICWAKNIPGYKDLLINDRVRLLETGWMEVLVLGASWRSVSSKGQIIHFADDLQMTREMAQVANFIPLFEAISGMTKRLIEAKVCREELLVLRVLLLLNSEFMPMEDHEKVKALREEYTDLLEITCRKFKGHNHLHCLEMILLLPHFRQISIYAIKHLFELQHEDSIPIGNLVRELMKSQTPVAVPAAENIK